MNQETLNQDTDQQTNQSQSPGVILRRAREAKKMRIEDVAERLCFRSNLVRFIEDDDYKELRSATFARGYLRAYAKLLDVPADDILCAFEKQGWGEKIESRKPAYIEAHDYGLNNRSFRWISYVIVFGLIVLVFLWWQSHSMDNKITLKSTTSNKSLSSEQTESQVLPLIPAENSTNQNVGQDAMSTMSQNSTAKNNL